MAYSDLTPLIALIWFLDDGSFWFSNTKNRSTTRLDLFTQGFSESENIYLSKILSEFIQGDVSIGASKGAFYLRLYNVSSRKFVSIIDPIYPEIMQRKAKWKNVMCDYYSRPIYTHA